MDKLGRPDWDDFFVTLTFVIAQRSLDKHTKCGCVVTKDNSILTTGYNSPPRGCVDEEIPLERPAKYSFMKHSEENAIINGARIGVSLKGSTFYITGPPCPSCFGDIISVGAKKIVYSSTQHSTYENEKDIIKLLHKGQKIIIQEHKSTEEINKIFTMAQEYFNLKIK